MTPEDFVAYHAKHIGGFLNKQDLHIDYASKLASNLEKLDKWSGGKLCRDPEGNLVTRDYGGDVVGKDDDGNLIVGDAPQPWTMVAIELDFILEIKRYARKLVRFVDRVGIVDLLTSEGVVLSATTSRTARSISFAARRSSLRPAHRITASYRCGAGPRRRYCGCMACGREDVQLRVGSFNGSARRL